MSYWIVSSTAVLSWTILYAHNKLEIGLVGWGIGLLIIPNLVALGMGLGHLFYTIITGG